MREGKRVFLTLDGLRGVAAIMIVLFHARALVGAFHPRTAYLSVDLFFALSGCVLEASYRERLAAGMKTRTFMLIRFIRLWPLFALSLLIALPFALMRLNAGVGHETPLGLAMGLATGMLLLPLPGLKGRDWLVPLNAAGWSLVAELAINFLYARFWRWLSDAMLWAVVALAGATLTTMSIVHGGIDMGSTWASAAGGLVRVLYSFSLGVLIFRAYDGRVRTGWASLLPVAVLVPLLAVGKGGLWFDLAAALVVMPLIVWTGLRLEPGPRLGRLFRWAGLTSYAIYALHGPVLHLARFEIVRHISRRPHTVVMLGLAAIALLLLLCAALDRWYDAPLRRAMSRLLLHRRRPPAEAAMSLP